MNKSFLLYISILLYFAVVLCLNVLYPAVFPLERAPKKLSARCASQFVGNFVWIKASQRATATEFGKNIPQSGACRLRE